MSDVWVWKVRAVGDSADPIDRMDVTGFDVNASDGRIGTVDEATYEPAASESAVGHLVVDTGFWIFGTKRMIPAGLITDVDPEGRTISLGVTKDQVKDAPDYDEVARERMKYRDEVGEHYQRFRGDTIGPTPGTKRAPEELTGDPIGPVAGTD